MDRRADMGCMAASNLPGVPWSTSANSPSQQASDMFTITPSPARSGTGSSRKRKGEDLFALAMMAQDDNMQQYDSSHSHEHDMSGLCIPSSKHRRSCEQPF